MGEGVDGMVSAIFDEMDSSVSVKRFDETLRILVEKIAQSS